MAGRATGYTDFYKNNTDTPDESTTGAAIKSRSDDAAPPDETKAEAIRRRLKAVNKRTRRS